LKRFLHPDVLRAELEKPFTILRLSLRIRIGVFLSSIIFGLLI
jgi:hypothetical protein